MSHAVGKSDEFLSSQPCSSSNSVKSIVYQRPSVHAKTLARSAVIEIRVMTPEALTTMWKSSKLQTACKKFFQEFDHCCTRGPREVGRAWAWRWRRWQGGEAWVFLVVHDASSRTGMRWRSRRADSWSWQVPVSPRTYHSSLSSSPPCEHTFQHSYVNLRTECSSGL